MRPGRVRLTAVLTSLLLVVTLGVATAATDTDGDTVPDDIDNCPRSKNTKQRDMDADGLGDACDACMGTKADVPTGVGQSRSVVNVLGCSVSQLCPCEGPRKGRAVWRHRSSYIGCVYRASHVFVRFRLMGPRERRALVLQAKASRCGLSRGVPGDRDGDGILEDGDGDEIPGSHRCGSRTVVGCDDNCPGRRNRDQVDLDKDGAGNRCDLDIDGDNVKNRRDNCPRAANPTQDDGDEDEVGDACDACKDSEEDADVGRDGCD